MNRLSLSRCHDSRPPVIGGYDEQFVLADRGADGAPPALFSKEPRSDAC